MPSLLYPPARRRRIRRSREAAARARRSRPRAVGGADAAGLERPGCGAACAAPARRRQLGGRVGGGVHGVPVRGGERSCGDLLCTASHGPTTFLLAWCSRLSSGVGPRASITYGHYTSNRLRLPRSPPRLRRTGCRTCLASPGCWPALQWTGLRWDGAAHPPAASPASDVFPPRPRH